MQQQLKKRAKKGCSRLFSLSLSSQKPRRHIGVSHGDMDFGHMGHCWTQTKQVRKVVKLARKGETHHAHCRRGKAKGKARNDTDGPISRFPTFHHSIAYLLPTKVPLVGAPWSN